MARRRTSRTDTKAKATKPTKSTEVVPAVDPTPDPVPADTEPEVITTKVDLAKLDLDAAKQAVRDAKAALAQARKDHGQAKRDISIGDDDSILAEARAEQAVPAAEKVLAKAKKNVPLIEKRLATAIESQKGDKATAAKDVKFLSSIKPQVKEITTRLDKATTAEGKADDMRLSAAQIMATVETQFIENKPTVKFKDWCETNGIVTSAKGRSWENLRKLLTVGKSDDPVAALEDLRAANAAANKRARAKADAESDGEEAAPKAAKVVLTATQTVQGIINGLVDEGDIDALVEIAEIVGDAVDLFSGDSVEDVLDHDDEATDIGEEIPEFLKRT